VAWRNGHRWARDFAPLPVSGNNTGGLRLRAGGTYLITGGLGRVGLVVAEHLARTVGARLVLCGRTPVPPRDFWETSPRFRRLLDLEALGAEVLPLCADVADPEALAAAVAQARERFGRIDGVLHAAGIVGEGSLASVQASGWAECAPQMRVKVQGLLALERVFAKEPPDFFLLFSSLAAFLGGLGYAAYAGANACLDAYAQELSRQGGAPWVSVDWEAWRFEETGKTALARQVEQLAITPEEGGRVLDLLFGGVPALPQVVVSTSDPQARLTDWKRREAMSEGAAGAAASGPAHARPNLHVAYVAPRNEAEEMVAAVWRELLGLEEIGVHDDFFELGGHSVLATQLVARLRQTLGAEVRLESFFKDPTIAGLAASVQTRPEDDAARRLEEILREVEGLTDEADGSIADLVGGLV
jgi:NADP-dependent 3-hydroxy acid dehydrogenase YdfG/acyl carrier protein